MDENQTPWSFPVAVDDIPETGLHIEIDAPEAVRAQLTAITGLRELVRLSAVFDLARRGAGVRVIGQVNARVGQICVVTLEPTESELEESLDLEFAPRLAESNSVEGRHNQSARSRRGTAGTSVRRQGGFGRDRYRIPASRHRPLSTQGGRQILPGQVRR
jgi:hypothetical protein